MILPILASWIAGIADVNHHAWSNNQISTDNSQKILLQNTILVSRDLYFIIFPNDFNNQLNSGISR
jgi:hypothetical protein